MNITWEADLIRAHSGASFPCITVESVEQIVERAGDADHVRGAFIRGPFAGQRRRHRNTGAHHTIHFGTNSRPVGAPAYNEKGPLRAGYQLRDGGGGIGIWRCRNRWKASESGGVGILGL